MKKLKMARGVTFTIVNSQTHVIKSGEPKPTACLLFVVFFFTRYLRRFRAFLLLRVRPRLLLGAPFHITSAL